MSPKFVVAGVGFVAAIGAAAGGATSFVSDALNGSQVYPVVFGAPVPLEPAANLPTVEQLSSILNGIADPAVLFVDKSDLIEDGVGPVEGNFADVGIRRAARFGELPLSFAVSNIQPAGPGRVRATVNISGPRLVGVTKLLTFVDQGGWKLLHPSAMSLLQATASSQR